MLKMQFYGDYNEDAFAKQVSGRTRFSVPIDVGLNVLTRLRALFIDTAGGCTEMPGTGYWHAYEGGRYASEPVVIFDVAGLPMEAVRRAAAMILEAGQTDVYVELASGQVVWFNSSSQEAIPKVS